MTTFAGIKSTEALKKTSGSTATLLYEHCVQVFYKKDVSSVSVSTNSGVLWCFPRPDWDPAGYICAAWYVWLWDVRIKWSPSPSGGLRHKHKATSVSSSSDCKLTMLAGLHMNNDYESCGYKRWICRVFVYNVRLCFITKIIFPFHVLFADQLGGFTAPPACPHLSTSVLLMVVCPFFWCRCG